MKRIRLYIASSIDGYIARKDGNLDWLTEFPNTLSEDYGDNDFFESMGVEWPYINKKTYVIAHRAMGVLDNVEFITQNIVKKISLLKKEEVKIFGLLEEEELLLCCLVKN